jgi:hypothetical protein
MIIGRDLITSLGIDAKGSNLSIKWDDAAIPWRDMDCTVADVYHADLHSAQPAEQELKRMTDILDAKYTKANLEEVVKNATHLTNKERYLFCLKRTKTAVAFLGGQPLPRELHMSDFTSEALMPFMSPCEPPRRQAD